MIDHPLPIKQQLVSPQCCAQCGTWSNSRRSSLIQNPLVCMRSCNLLPRSSRLISKSQRTNSSLCFVRPYNACLGAAAAYSRRQPGPSTRLTKKQLSTITPNSTELQNQSQKDDQNGRNGVAKSSGSGPEEPPEGDESPQEPPPFTEEPEKVKTRRPRLSAASKELDTVSLPGGLNILYDPSSSEDHGNGNSARPPPDIFENALHNLHLTLHPHIQHQAAYPSQSSSRLEPTLALYCPIEGGDYVIDATVREMARATNSEVVILDSVHLAAGEWGMFGKGSYSRLLLLSYMQLTPCG